MRGLNTIAIARVRKEELKLLAKLRAEARKPERYPRQ